MRASVDLPDPDGPTMARDSPGASSSETPLSTGSLELGGRYKTRSTVRRPCGLGRSSFGVSLERLDRLLDPPVGRSRLNAAAPSFDQALEWLQGTAGDDRSRNHHAAGDLGLKGQIRARAQNRDLGHEPDEL